ncbi:MAG: hypothetical protein ACKO39_06465, partial [Chthoniobacterales bacterium]
LNNIRPSPVKILCSRHEQHGARSLRPYSVCRMPLAMRSAHCEMQRQRGLPQPGPLEWLERLNKVQMH